MRVGRANTVYFFSLLASVCWMMIWSTTNSLSGIYDLSWNEPPVKITSESKTILVGASEKRVLNAVDVLSQPVNTQAASVKQHKNHQHLSKCNSTVVTAYFRIKSKHSFDSYNSWMKNTLSIHDCMVIFTSADMVSTMLALRQHAMTVVIQTEIDDLPISQLHREDPNFWQHQLNIDPERRLHQSYQLFWIWLSKPWFVTQAIDLDFFQSETYMWVDIGSFRNERFTNSTLIQYPHVIPSSSLLWTAFAPPNPPPNPVWNAKNTDSRHFYHIGTVAAGYKQPWKDYHKEFAIMMDRFLDANLFIGEDQCLLQGTCQQNPELCIYIPVLQPKLRMAGKKFGRLRYVLHRGGNYETWQPPQLGAQKVSKHK